MDGGTESADFRAELAAKDVEIADLEAQVTKLTEALTQLHEKLDQDSTNSNLPPSSDPPGRAAGGKKKRGKRSRGSLKGHRGSLRHLLPPEVVDDFVEFFTQACEGCSEVLPEVVDRFAKRYQHGLAVGARWHYAHSFYADYHYAGGVTPPNPLNNDIHRIGPFFAYTFKRNPGGRVESMTALLLANWYVTHRFRTGLDSPTAFPFISLAFAFEGDQLSDH